MITPMKALPETTAMTPRRSSRELASAMLDAPTPQLSLWSDTDPSELWAVRESRRARRLAVRVFRSGRVEIVVPTRTSRLRVEDFIARHRVWIERKRAEARRHAAVSEPFPPRQVSLSGCGEVWQVQLAGGNGRPRLVPVGDILRLRGDCNDAHGLRQALRRWLMGRARVVLDRLLWQCARERGFHYERMIVRRQRTRWGSCSARGTISLNCCLLFQRHEVLDYLLVHELAHTRHLNHSRRFWRCVAEHCPDHRALDRELLDGWRRVPAWVFDA